MDRNLSFYENMGMMDPYFPVIFHYDRLSLGKNSNFPSHWHDKIEFLYFVKGKGVIVCNTCPIAVKPGDLAVVNSNELHKGYCVTEFFEYYCIIVDTSLFLSYPMGACETRYINPIYQNNILFKNKIESNDEIKWCINGIVEEYKMKATGFELSVKSYLYRLLVLLLRNHTKLVLSSSEYDSRLKNLQRLNTIVRYIENQYHEQITIDKLCNMANLSRFYFCRLFKDITGKTVSSYINQVRINNAERMLKDSSMNVTEVAAACGFYDASYFSRTFKKLKKKTPLQVLREAKRPVGGSS